MRKLQRIGLMLVVVIAIAAPAVAHNRSASITPAIDLRYEIAASNRVQSLPLFAGVSVFDEVARVEVPPSIADELARRFAAGDAEAHAQQGVFNFAANEKVASWPLGVFAANNVNETRELSLDLRRTEGNARNRWYDPETGTFLTPDPMGYADSSNLYAFCGGDPVNCSDPTGERGMTAEDARQLAQLRARGKKLHDEFTSSGRATFQQPMRVPVARKWHDTSGVPGGNYETQMVTATVTEQASYELARRTMVNDVGTFEAAVARADANGEILYVPGQGFTTLTAADRKAADRATMVAAGVFFTTNTVPLMLSPYGMRGQIVRPAELPKEYRQDVLVLGHYSEPGFRSYIDVADELGAHRFSMPPRIWSSMTPEQRHAANMRTLDRAIARGAEIKLTTPPLKARAGSPYEEELVYMYIRGYGTNAEGTRLIAPLQGCPACISTPQQKR